MTGHVLGHYRLEEKLGAGAMGEVYRARDEKLDRDVAVKVLPAGALSDEAARRRFRKEADALSRVSHPHIATIHDFDSADGIDFLVMELVPGPSIDEELRRGPLPEKDVVRLGGQMARGLQAAHEQGVIHRDLKPSNLRLTEDGMLKILDFGVARLEQNARRAAGDATATETADGQVVGTLPYMAPEQLRGRGVDTRTDLYAAGAVLYEMATGRKLFPKPSAAELTEAILNENPVPPREVNERISPGLESVILKALDKDPELRHQTAKDLRADLERLQQRSGAPSGTASIAAGLEGAWAAGSSQERRRTTRERLAWAALVLLVGGVAALSAWHLARPVEVPRIVRFGIDIPDLLAHDTIDLAVSPAGRHVAFAPWSSEGSLWLRSLDTRETRRLPGTDGASAPFWSPDGNSIAFFGYGGRGELVLRRITLDTGDVQTICGFSGGFWGGGTWNDEGRILFGGGDEDERFRIHTVSAAGGEPAVLFGLDPARNERGHSNPQFLPDGRSFLYQVDSGDPEASGIWRSSLDSPQSREIVLPGALGEYAASGHLLYYLLDRPDGLIVRPFDAGRSKPRGEATTVLQMPMAPGTWSAGGNVLVYLERGLPAFNLTWFDRAGLRLGTVGAPASYGRVQLSADGSRAAVAFGTQGNWDVWTIDLERGLPTRVTSHPGTDGNGVWSRDGREVFFSSDRGGGGVWRLYRKRQDGTGPATLLHETARNEFPKAVTPDGTALLFVTGGPPSNDSVWALPLLGEGDPELVLKVPYSLDDPQVSPDGRWLAYCANDTGGWEVYLMPYGREGERIPVSLGGGRQPRWRGDSRELFYVTPQGELMAVPVRETEDGLQLGRGSRLFNAGVRSRTRSQYGVTGDGQRFLVITPADGNRRSLEVVLNWTALLE
ncbi:MAG: protein kinase [Acidobacteria bacterium]|nr:protein kinase [Acidobacteriota bacterium]